MLTAEPQYHPKDEMPFLEKEIKAVPPFAVMPAELGTPRAALSLEVHARITCLRPSLLVPTCTEFCQRGLWSSNCCHPELPQNSGFQLPPQGYKQIICQPASLLLAPGCCVHGKVSPPAQDSLEIRHVIRFRHILMFDRAPW